MEQIDRVMTHEFEAEAASVLNSVYFKPDWSGDRRRFIADTERLSEERRTLQAALASCVDYSSLRGAAKRIYDRARAAMGGGS